MSELVIERNDGQIVIRSDFWKAIHRLECGGAIASIEILHGSGSNLLRGPVGAAVDTWSEIHEKSPSVTIKRTKTAITLEIGGWLTDRMGKPGPIRYVHTYHYTLFSMRNELSLMPQRIMSVKKVIASEMSLAGWLDEYSWGSTDFEKIQPRYIHILGPHYDDVFGRFSPGKGRVFDEATRPWQVSIFQRGREGICWTGDSRQYAWEKPLGEGTSSRFSLAKDATGSSLRLAPLDHRHPVPWKNDLHLAWYLILPNVPQTCRTKYYEVTVGTSPFLTRTQIAELARSGVNLIRIHDDVDTRGLSREHWQDGRYPPFSQKKMRLLAEFVRHCHQSRIKVISYFSGWELYPTTPAFKKYADRWYAPSRFNGHMRFTPSPGAGVFGALMCPDSGWGEFLERHIRQTVDGVGLDGYYLDWSSPGPCFNHEHHPGHHNGADGLVRLLERTRDWLEDRLMVIHSGGQLCWLMHHNIADQIVTMEEGKKDGGCFDTLSEYPASLQLMGSGALSIVPGVYQNSPKIDEVRMRLKQGLALSVLLNALPYSPWDGLGFGYTTWQEALKDRDGILTAYRTLSRFDFSKYRFYDAFSGVAGSSRSQIGCAAYVGTGSIILVVSNMGKTSVGGTEVMLKCPGLTRQKKVKVGPLKGFEFKLLPIALNR
jgi:hypothetical protein